MSASEKLKALDQELTKGFWIIDDDSDDLHPDALAYMEDDATHIATLRNALPQIITALEAAERVPRLRYSNEQPSLSLSWDAKNLITALSDLEKAL